MLIKKIVFLLILLMLQQFFIFIFYNYVMYNRFHLQIPFLLYVLTFECFFKNNVQVTLWYKNMWVVEAWYVGNFGFRRVQSKFEGEIIKHHQNLDHGYVKHFQVFKKAKISIIFRKYSFGCFYMKLVFGQAF